jgi:hypothetical protein
MFHWPQFQKHESHKVLLRLLAYYSGVVRYLQTVTIHILFFAGRMCTRPCQNTRN